MISFATSMMMSSWPATTRRLPKAMKMSRGSMAISFAMRLTGFRKPEKTPANPLTTLVGPGTALAALAALAVLGRVGLGFILPSLNLAALADVPPALLAQGTSLINLLRQLGGAAGISLMGVLLQWRLDAAGPEHALRAYHETLAALAAVTALAMVAAWRLRTRRAEPHGVGVGR